MSCPCATKYVYGPVPSRRLGRSLGIDLVPFKTCSYDCIYCQLGRTTNRTIERLDYAPIDAILDDLARRLASISPPDFIGLAGSGEPTLHLHIGALIEGIKRLTKTPVAVLTNGSLLWLPEVRESLMAAELVMPSLDAGEERLFRRINRPHPSIAFSAMVDGIQRFVREFRGEVWLEVFLLAELTGDPAAAKKIADIAARIAPARVQLNSVHRPPAEQDAAPVSARNLRQLEMLFPGRVEIIAELKAEGPGGP